MEAMDATELQMPTLDAHGRGAAVPLARSVERRELADATGGRACRGARRWRKLAEQYAPGRRGLRLRELGGGWTLASDPAAEDAARRLFSRPRVATLSPAQAETLAIVAYLQPISRPEIARIRGVSADSATATLLDRGLIEEAGHSQFGAVLYRTTHPFLKLFGLRSLDELPDIARWDPTPEEQAELRERLLRPARPRRWRSPAGSAHSPPALRRQLPARGVDVAPAREAHRRGTSRDSSTARNAAIDSRLEPCVSACRWGCRGSG